MQYYVTYSEYYPIYEHAEGGYYYSGKDVLQVWKCNTLRKANKRFRKLLKETDLEFDASYFDGKPFINNRIEYKSFGVHGRYIGDGYIVELTREPVEPKGRVPYC